MSKSSSKSSKSSAKKYPPKSTAKSKTPKRPQRGTWLTIALVLMVLHGIVAALFFYFSKTDPAVDRTWMLSLMVVHSLANIAAAVGIWYWKKWALYVYAASTIVALVVGLLSVGIWSVFYMVLPLAIMGWVLRTKWDYFTD